MDDFEGTKLNSEKPPLTQSQDSSLSYGEILKATPFEFEAFKEEKVEVKEEVNKPSVEKQEPVKKETEAPPTAVKEEIQKEKPVSDDYSKIKVYQAGDYVKGKVVRIEKNGVLVDIRYKSEGLMELNELSSRPNVNPENVVAVGQEVEVVILQLESKDGYVIVSKKKADYERGWKNLFQAYKKRETLTADVISTVTGGLVVDYLGIRGFIPASQVLKKSEESLYSFVGKEMFFKVLEVDRKKRKVVFSHRLAEEEEQKLQNERLFEDLEIGQVRHGKVTSIKSFGVFVSLAPNIEGLIHISELSWKRVTQPQEVVSIGQDLDVFVLGVDKESRKISLGLKQLQADPWVEVKKIFQIGQIIQGRITRLVKFGAFVELENGLEGLIHIGELAYPTPAKPEEVVKVGEIVKVKVLRVIPEEQKIGLSLKDAPVSDNQLVSPSVTVKDVIDKEVSAQLENVREQAANE